MKKWLTLEEGADCIIFRDSASLIVKSIPYDAITEITIQNVITGPLDVPGLIIIKADGREHKIYYEQVSVPVTANVNALFAELWSWIYSDTAPTPEE